MKNAVFVLLSLAALSCATTTGPLHIPADPCTLLTAADIGRTPVEVKSSGQQCFYRMEPFADSISLSLVPNARELWEKMEKGEREEEGEGEKESHVREIEGLGDDALWSTLPVGATLYVRTGDAMLRISTGGKMSDAERLEKSKRLARAALRRLR